MRRLFVALALVLTGCGDLQPAAQALAPASPLPTSPALATPLASPTPLPSSAIDPQVLIKRVKGLTGIVLRVDDVATRLMTSGDYMGSRTVPGPTVNVPPMVWVVAVIGEMRPSFGVISMPNFPCGLFAFSADTGDIWSTGGGSLAHCQPYFARSLTPPDAPLRCPTAAYDNGVGLPSLNTFSQTRPGPFAFTAVRDDAWRQPTTVTGGFLAQAPEGVQYDDAFCLKAFVRQGPNVEALLASGVGAVVPRVMPPLEWAIWLRGYHAVSGSADAAGHIDVVVEPKAGYEWAFFDWHALVPGGGYVMFRFSDASGREILPWRLANGP